MGLAAGAAVAAWMGVRETRRAARAAIEPELVVEALLGPDHHLDVLIHNAGLGIARNVYVLLVAEGQRVDTPTRAVLGPSESFRIGTAIEPARGESAAPRLVVTGRDIRQRTWAWTEDGERREIPRKKGRDAALAAFEALWPQASLAGLPDVDWFYRFGAPAIARAGGERTFDDS